MAVIKAIAQLDCLLSLSKSSAALGEPCVRPEVVESDTAFADFEELRHPCIFRWVVPPLLFSVVSLAYLYFFRCSASTDFIPNDVAIGGDARNLTLLTGPNVSRRRASRILHWASSDSRSRRCRWPAKVLFCG